MMLKKVTASLAPRCAQALPGNATDLRVRLWLVRLPLAKERAPAALCALCSFFFLIGGPELPTSAQLTGRRERIGDAGKGKDTEGA